MCIPFPSLSISLPSASRSLQSIRPIYTPFTPFESVESFRIISTNELGTEKILCSWRQRCLRLSLLATSSHECLRRDSGVEEWVPSCGTIWDIIQVSRSFLGKLSKPQIIEIMFPRSIRFGNERFKPRHGERQPMPPVNIASLTDLISRANNR